MLRTLVILGLNLSKIGSIEGPDTFITNTYLKKTQVTLYAANKLYLGIYKLIQFNKHISEWWMDQRENRISPGTNWNKTQQNLWHPLNGVLQGKL